MTTVTSSIRSASSGRRIPLNLPNGRAGKPARPPDGIASDASAIRLLAMREPTREDVDALVGPATPHFAYQLRARVRELVEGLPEGHDVRVYGEAKMELLDRLGHASSKAEEGPRVARDRPGWDEIPSAATADEPLPRR